MRRIYAVLGAAAAVAAMVAVIGVTSGTAAPSGRAAATAIYMDPSAPISARVHDLLRRMTLREKVGQMDQAVIGLLRPE